MAPHLIWQIYSYCSVISVRDQLPHSQLGLICTSIAVCHNLQIREKKRDKRWNFTVLDKVRFHMTIIWALRFHYRVSFLSCYERKIQFSNICQNKLGLGVFVAIRGLARSWQPFVPICRNPAHVTPHITFGAAKTLLWAGCRSDETGSFKCR